MHLKLAELEAAREAYAKLSAMPLTPQQAEMVRARQTAMAQAAQEATEVEETKPKAVAPRSASSVPVQPLMAVAANGGGGQRGSVGSRSVAEDDEEEEHTPDGIIADQPDGWHETSIKIPETYHDGQPIPTRRVSLDSNVAMMKHRQSRSSVAEDEEEEVRLLSLARALPARPLSPSRRASSPIFEFSPPHPLVLSPSRPLTLSLQNAHPSL